MRVFKLPAFARFARREGITDRRLAEAISLLEQGLVDADLGGGLVKQRIARPGKGKSGRFRTVIAYRQGRRAVFLFGFAKSERDNLSLIQLADLKRTAADVLKRGDANIAKDLQSGDLQEVRYGEDA